MAGRFAGTKDTPGNIIETTNGKYKVYRGMASKEAQRDWKGSVSSREGISTHVQYKGSTESVLEDLVVGIRSGFSYSGAKFIGVTISLRIFTTNWGWVKRKSNTHLNSKVMSEKKNKNNVHDLERVKAEFKIRLQYDSLTQVKFF